MKPHHLKSEVRFRVEVMAHPSKKWEAQGHSHISLADAEQARAGLHTKFGSTRIVEEVHSETVLITYT